HTAFAKNTLVSSKMNLFSGGFVLKMQDTMWNGNHQSMIIEEDYFIYDNKTKSYINLHGQPKGLKWEPNSDVVDCCACRLMASQPDFLAQHGQ
ncbi:13820_t:CDS:2, partial [Cetraspora pellucida]